MSNYFGQRMFVRSPMQEKVLPLVGLAMVALLACASFMLLFQTTPVRKTEVQPASGAAAEMVDVLVPLYDIVENATLDPTMFKKVSRRADSISPKTVRDYETIKDQFARSLILAGEPLNSGYLSSRRSALEGPVRNRIPKGFRAVTMKVDDTQAVDGLVRPGEIVDVSWVHRMNGALAVSILVQNAKVLVADRQVDPNWKPGMPIPGTITLLVSAVDYNYVELGKASGKLGLALRGSDGVGVGDAGPTITEANMPGARTAAPQPEAPSCQGKITTCVKPGQCEVHCLKADGTLALLDPKPQA